MTKFLTPEQLGDVLEVTGAQVLEWRRQYRWPSLKIGKTIRFTPEHVQQIVARHTLTPKRDDDAAGVVFDGQTSRSARRAS